MDFQERRVAQIVRDFIEAYVLADRVMEGLGRDALDFGSVRSWVGDSDDSALYRLKEETHGLFRVDASAPQAELAPKATLQAEALFDLAVGALFHEAMRFRESYYVTASYEPRLARMIADGEASLALSDAFSKAFGAGRQRMIGSAASAKKLLVEARDQLLNVLRELPPSGIIARSLVADPAHTRHVLGCSVDEILTSFYGSPAEGYRLAVACLVDCGHFGEALSLVERDSVARTRAFAAPYAAFLRGMQCHYAGDSRGAVQHLGTWIEGGESRPAEWRAVARRALRSAIESGDIELEARARALDGTLMRSTPHASA
jgi:hypothetical protein